jgi:hypothetical protein
MTLIDRLVRDLAKHKGVTEEWVRNYYGITEEDK